ncbi:hypothetical protein ES288_D06G188500v1 [Gossypium darwinii]|uniref:Uncharacterized protein n=1 Tax=Gossypium darwinii TaxID=34276 RepID=A0A5D2CAV7_GOSDA|nr:hypothetical protein ES288_D06G188500v1 [Gossypium darwinii]
MNGDPSFPRRRYGYGGRIVTWRAVHVPGRVLLAAALEAPMWGNGAGSFWGSLLLILVLSFYNRARVMEMDFVFGPLKPIVIWTMAYFEIWFYFYL